MHVSVHPLPSALPHALTNGCSQLMASNERRRFILISRRSASLPDIFEHENDNRWETAKARTHGERLGLFVVLLQRKLSATVAAH